MHWCRSVSGPKCLRSEVSVHALTDYELVYQQFSNKLCNYADTSLQPVTSDEEEVDDETTEHSPTSYHTRSNGRHEQASVSGTIDAVRLCRVAMACGGGTQRSELQLRPLGRHYGIRSDEHAGDPARTTQPRMEFHFSRWLTAIARRPGGDDR